MEPNEHSWLLEAIDRASEEAGLKEFEPIEPEEKALRAQVVRTELVPRDGEVLVKRDDSGRITELISKSYRRILNRDGKGRLIGYTEHEKRAI